MNEEETKEIKDINQIPQPEMVVEQTPTVAPETQEEDTPVIVEPVEEPVLEPIPEEKEQKPNSNKKKLIIILIVVAVVLILAGVIILFTTKKEKKEESNTVQTRKVSNFEKVVTKSLKSGDLVKEINKGLEKNGIHTEKVSIISMDIDSDNDQELIVYAEEGTQKAIIQLELEEEVTYEDSYPLTAIDSLGYAYSSEKRKNLWFAESDGNYTIISTTKIIIQEETFLENYLVLTKTYENDVILKRAIEYHMDKNLDVKELEKTKIEKKDFEEDNQITTSELSKKFEEYLEKKQEEDKKKKEEEERLAKEEELKQKLSGTLQLGSHSFQYGTYNVYDANGNFDGQLILYKDLTCEHKGSSCTYTVGTIKDEEGKEYPGISLNSGQKYIVSNQTGELTDLTKTISIRYAG